MFSSARHHDAGDLAERGLGELTPVARMLSTQFLFADPPTHTRVRGALRDQFTPAAVRAHDPALRAIAAELVAELPERGTSTSSPGTPARCRPG